MSEIAVKYTVARSKFDQKVQKIFGLRLLTSERIAEVIKLVDLFNVCDGDSDAAGAEAAYYARHCDVRRGDGRAELVLRTPAGGARVLPAHLYYQVLKLCHATLKHGAPEEMIQALMQQSRYIPPSIVKLFVHRYCSKCKGKIQDEAKTKQRCFTVGTIDIIDFQHMPDGKYKSVLYYRDDISKYVILRPLFTDYVCDVAAELMKIFLLVGFPMDLRSCRGQQHAAQVLRELQRCLAARTPLIKQRAPQEGAPARSLAASCLLEDWVRRHGAHWATSGLAAVQYQLNVLQPTGGVSSPYRNFIRKATRVLIVDYLSIERSESVKNGDSDEANDSEIGKISKPNMDTFVDEETKSDEDEENAAMRAGVIDVEEVARMFDLDRAELAKDAPSGGDAARAGAAAGPCGACARACWGALRCSACGARAHRTCGQRRAPHTHPAYTTHFLCYKCMYEQTQLEIKTINHGTAQTD